MDKIIPFITKNKVNFILLIIWAIIVSVTMFHHEIWRDEAQIWLLARDCNLVELFKQTRIEGHPIFWYLLIMPFAKLGFDIISMQILSVIFVFAGVAFLIFKSPFNYLMKMVFIFSAGMVYYLPVIARNYALIPIFLFMLAELYPQKGESYKHPYLFAILLILLSNTHLFMLIFCITLSVYFIWNQLKLPDKTFKSLLPSILLVLNFSILISLFINVPQMNIWIGKYNLVYPFWKELIPVFIFENSNYFVFIFCILLFLVFIRFLQKDIKLFLCIFSTFVYFYILHKQIWYGGIIYQKSFLAFLVIMFCYWIINKTEKDKILTILVFLTFSISFIHTPYCIYKEIKHNFSEAKQLAEYIKHNLNDEKEFLINSDDYSENYTGIFAYLKNKKFYFLQFNKYTTYFDFSHNPIRNTDKKPDSKYLIKLQNSEIYNDPEYNYELIYQTDMDEFRINHFGMTDEHFEIYKRTKKNE